MDQRFLPSLTILLFCCKALLVIILIHLVNFVWLQCSIDVLLEKTIMHLLFLRNVNLQVDNLKHNREELKVIGLLNAGVIYVNIARR